MAAKPLRYGENPYQTATLELDRTSDPLAFGKFRQLAGTDASFVNVTDIDRAVQTLVRCCAALEVNSQPHTPYGVAVAVKHGNSCGAAYSLNAVDALKKMIEGDRQAILGATVVCNFEVDSFVADVLLTHKSPGRRIIDVVVAPAITPDAAEKLSRKADRCKMFVNPSLAHSGVASLDTTVHTRKIRGGILRQESKPFILDFRKLRPKRIGKARPDLRLDLAFAAGICATSNSNTVTLVKQGMFIGNGVAQTKRSMAAAVAVSIARSNEHDPKDGVAVSDSFFPFPDGIWPLTEAGVAAIFASSGSINDQSVQEYCREKGVTLYHLPDAQARMFFGH